MVCQTTLTQNHFRKANRLIKTSIHSLDLEVGERVCGMAELPLNLNFQNEYLYQTHHVGWQS